MKYRRLYCLAGSGLRALPFACFFKFSLPMTYSNEARGNSGSSFTFASGIRQPARTVHMI